MQEPEDHTLFLSTADAKTYHGFCCYRYDDCVVYQAERQRIWDQRHTLAETDPDLLPDPGI